MKNANETCDPWLRAAVLGANDGIVSTASLVVGVAAANTGSNDILVADVAGLVAGASDIVGRTSDGDYGRHCTNGTTMSIRGFCGPFIPHTIILGLSLKAYSLHLCKQDAARTLVPATARKNENSRTRLPNVVTNRWASSNRSRLPSLEVVPLAMLHGWGIEALRCHVQAPTTNSSLTANSIFTKRIVDLSNSKNSLPGGPPDQVKIKGNIIVTIPESDHFNRLPDRLIQPLRNQSKRDWLVPHAYHCLPLLIGSQYGFIVKSLYDFWVVWDGGNEPNALTIRKRPEDEAIYDMQVVGSHFGMGIITIQNRWTFRTGDGINLMTVAPPNYWIDGISHLVGVIETDNLRRDFTFNLKVTRPKFEIKISAGTPIGCVLPIPRGYVDSFEIKNAKDVLPPEVIQCEQEAVQQFAAERLGADRSKPGGNGKRYWRGEDVYGNPFPDHQTKLNEPDKKPKP